MNDQFSPVGDTTLTDCCSGGPEMISVEQAIATASQLATGVAGTQVLPLVAAHGRICGRDVFAGHPLPNFNNSAMDGYAINLASLKGDGPWTLEITGRMAAGDKDIGAQKSPTGALRILTGALVPDGYDAVIMQENCVVKGNQITFSVRPNVQANIRPAGEDCQPGDIVVAKGQTVDARKIAFAASQGSGEIAVFRKVRVAIFSTGSELKLPGQELASGQIYNSNRYQLASQLDLPYVELIDLGSIRDEPELLKQTMAEAAEMADLVITTGGVSVGDEDHMPGTITDLGGTLHITKVAIKPGKPVTVGTLGQTMFLGLPGNPVAAFVNFMLIGRAIVEKLAGKTVTPLLSYPVSAGFSRKRSPKMEEYAAAQIIGSDDNGLQTVELIKKAGSANLAALARSDGFVVFPSGLESVDRGDQLKFIPHKL